LILIGTAVMFVPWCVFARHEFGKIIPTTLAAKSTHHLHLVNLVIAKQMAESVVESFLFPALLVLLLLVTVRWKPAGREESGEWLRWVLPAGWVVGLVGFYYLKTPGLQSTGRYVLPLLPAEVMLLAFCWANAEPRMRLWQKRAAYGLIAAHVVFALALNALVIAPVLRRFDPEYATTMRATADELARDLQGKSNRRVLVVMDIGVLSCEADGRFEIYDAGALATPSLLGLSLDQMIQKVHPAYVVQSLAETPDGFGPEHADQLSAVWKRRFLRYSVGEQTPYYYTIIYQAKGDQEASAPKDSASVAGVSRGM
jgi:hypothetical protein